MKDRIADSAHCLDRVVSSHGMDPSAAILLLSELPGVGERTLGAVLRQCAVEGLSPCSALEHPEKAGLPEVAASAARRITDKMRSAAVSTARTLRASGVEVLTAQDPLYPRRLLEDLPDPPAVVYAYGALGMLSAKTFAVANSNAATEAALALSDAAAEKLVQAGATLVTGHNRPAYQRSALCALRFGGRSCYVLDRGILEAFDGDLRRELFAAAHVWSASYDPSTTLALSPFTLRAHAIGRSNRRRDELIFALADTILVGEITAGGQMESRVRAALEHGKQVRLVGPSSDRDDPLLAAGAVRGVPQQAAT